MIKNKWISRELAGRGPGAGRVGPANVITLWLAVAMVTWLPCPQAAVSAVIKGVRDNHVWPDHVVFVQAPWHRDTGTRVALLGLHYHCWGRAYPISIIHSKVVSLVFLWGVKKIIYIEYFLRVYLDTITHPAGSRQTYLTMNPWHAHWCTGGCYLPD